MRGKRLIGITIIVASIVALVVWEKWGKDRFIYEDYLVLTSNMAKGEVVSEEMFSVVKTGSWPIGALKPKDMDRLIGKEASQFIHKDGPIFKEYFEENGLIANFDGGKYRLLIHRDWIFSRPLTLSKGERAYFYLGKKFITSGLVSYVNTEEESFEVIFSEKQVKAIGSVVYKGEKVIISVN